MSKHKFECLFADRWEICLLKIAVNWQTTLSGFSIYEKRFLVVVIVIVGTTLDRKKFKKKVKEKEDTKIINTNKCEKNLSNILIENSQSWSKDFNGFDKIFCSFLCVYYDI